MSYAEEHLLKGTGRSGATPEKCLVIARKWADKFKRGDVQVADWDLMMIPGPEKLRNADAEYYFLQALVEMHKEEYGRGWNDAVTKVSLPHQQQLEAVRKNAENNPEAELVVKALKHEVEILKKNLKLYQDKYDTEVEA